MKKEKTRRKLNDVCLLERDELILAFIYKWKVCSTALIASRFFKRGSTSAYNRLQELSNAGFVQALPIDQSGSRFVWELDKRGFRQLFPDTTSLQDLGYLSEAPIHDSLVTAVHLGEWNCFSPEGVEFVSEQELRRKRPASLPAWTPIISGRRPDGYWLIPKGNANYVVALEVELSTKDYAEYGPIGEAYSHTDSIRRVCWLVESETSAEKIQEVFKSSSPSKYERHNFILVDDFKNNGWDAKVLLGFEKGKTLRHSICLGEDNLVELSLKLRSSFNPTSTLDFRKCPFKSTNCGKQRPIEISHCMATPPIHPILSQTQSPTLASAPNELTSEIEFIKEEDNNE